MKPVYTLKQLIYDKYREDRFALGCELVAHWIQFEIKNKAFDAVWINKICNMPPDKASQEIPYEVAEILRKLFGLKTMEELFTSTKMDTV